MQIEPKSQKWYLQFRKTLLTNQKQQEAPISGFNMSPMLAAQKYKMEKLLWCSRDDLLPSRYM